MSQVNIEGNPEIERNWGMLAHLLGLVPIPFINVLGPLLVWLVKKDQSTFIESHAREAANFQVSILIAYFISVWLCMIFIGFVLLAVIAISNLVLVFMAAIKAKNGESFRYPLSFRFF